MNRLLIVAFLALTTSCTLSEVEAREISDLDARIEVRHYLEGYFADDACVDVVGFDSECTPSGICTVAITCYQQYGASPARGNSHSTTFDLMCINGECTLSTYR